MPNSIRTPRRGTSDTSRRIAEAVDDEEWQVFRVSLKGQTTAFKLGALRQYLEAKHDEESHGPSFIKFDIYHCNVCIRVDNYLKALARGGQIESVVAYLPMLVDRKLVIRK